MMGKCSDKILIKKDFGYMNFLFSRNGIGVAEGSYQINLFFVFNGGE
jgi:hypothetical protein